MSPQGLVSRELDVNHWVFCFSRVRQTSRIRRVIVVVSCVGLGVTSFCRATFFIDSCRLHPLPIFVTSNHRVTFSSCRLVCLLRIPPSALASFLCRLRNLPTLFPVGLSGLCVSLESSRASSSVSSSRFSKARYLELFQLVRGFLIAIIQLPYLSPNGRLCCLFSTMSSPTFHMGPSLVSAVGSVVFAEEPPASSDVSSV
nr:hypothetical protein Iba_chr02dCG7540 [Ipomoea batatas]GMD72041.1 hypothetical protein Iba_chr12fCG4740 [Ipomoea batatas]